MLKLVDNWVSLRKRSKWKRDVTNVGMDRNWKHVLSNRSPEPNHKLRKQFYTICKLAS